jgi:hypothetical protein
VVKPVTPARAFEKLIGDNDRGATDRAVASQRFSPAVSQGGTSIKEVITHASVTG